MIDRIYANADMLDGRTITGVRVLATDRIKAQKIARHNSIPWTTGPECESLIAYTALTRTGDVTATNYDDFLNELADFRLTDTAPEATQEDADPTSGVTAL